MPVWAVVKAKPTTDHVVAHSVLCSLLPALGAPVVLDSTTVVLLSAASGSGSSTSSASVSSSMMSFPLPWREEGFRGEGAGTFEAGGLRSSSSTSSSPPPFLGLGPSFPSPAFLTTAPSGFSQEASPVLGWWKYFFPASSPSVMSCSYQASSFPLNSSCESQGSSCLRR